MTAYKTGGDIDAYCSKCKLVLAHVITAMNTTRVLRVECKTCRGVHVYRKEAPASGTRRARGDGKSSTGTRGAPGPSDYEKVIKGHDMSQAQRYRTTTNYAEGDVIDHPTFKLGVVMRVLADSKMEVIFPDPEGLKVLVHARVSQAEPSA